MKSKRNISLSNLRAIKKATPPDDNVGSDLDLGDLDLPSNQEDDSRAKEKRRNSQFFLDMHEGDAKRGK